jgi:hypothetical protein
MKKLLVLITVMVAVFGFSTGAFAAWGDPICTTCKGCNVEHIPCTISAGQDMTPVCPGFEYDSFPAKPPRSGYCEYKDNLQNCRAIFNICNCEDPSIFDVPEVIGIRMTVLVDGVAGQLGAYWADPSVTDIDMYTYGTADGEPCGTPANPETFGAINYWQSDRITTATPLPGTSCDPIPAGNQAVVLFSATATTGYTIKPVDVTEKRHEWWIDIPGMRIDRNVLHDDELISVKIELLAAGTGGICADCDAVCECIINVANVCCEDPEVSYSMYFPYVVTQNATWSTGIVVTNLSSSVAIADMEATFRLTDWEGNEFTYTKTDFDAKVWAFGLDTELPNFSGTPAPGSAWLKVETNFNTDGWQFMTDGFFGAGTLPRLPCMD